MPVVACPPGFSQTKGLPPTISCIRAPVNYIGIYAGDRLPGVLPALAKQQVFHQLSPVFALPLITPAFMPVIACPECPPALAKQKVFHQLSPVFGLPDNYTGIYAGGCLPGLLPALAKLRVFH